MRRIFYFIFLIVLALNIRAQESNTVFLDHEIQLLHDFQAISHAPINQKKDKEKKFFDAFYKVLNMDGSMDHNFDTLKNIGKIQSADESIIIYTWNIPDEFGFNKYYGIIQYYHKKEKQVIATKLIENQNLFRRDNQAHADSNNWYGALYYGIVEIKYQGSKYYTILGFNFNTLLSNIKVVETFTIDRSGKPVFIAGSFIQQNRKLNRLIFEYAEQAQMTLRYDAESEQIILDHLAPSRPSLENQFQFYGPDGSYDALIFEDGIWHLKSDIGF